MAGRNFTPVMFGLEKNLVFLYARCVFNPSGVPVLDTLNSKGICSINPYTPTFTGSTVSSSATVTSVSSFAGIFTGQTITGTGLQSSTTIGTISAATGSIVLNKAVNTGVASLTLVAGAGSGQYLIQFGRQAGVNLDTYYKFVEMQHSFDMTTSSAIGTATQAQLAPLNPSLILIGNQTQVRTIPATSTSNSTDATLQVQFGVGAGTNFVAGSPATGEAVRFAFVFGNSSAI